MRSLRVGHVWETSLSLFTFHFHPLEKEMATHSSVLAWRIPEAWEPGGLRSMGSHRVGHDWSDLAAAEARAPSHKLFTILYFNIFGAAIKGFKTGLTNSWKKSLSMTVRWAKINRTMIDLSQCYLCEEKKKTLHLITFKQAFISSVNNTIKLSVKVKSKVRCQ